MSGEHDELRNHVGFEVTEKELRDGVSIPWLYCATDHTADPDCPGRPATHEEALLWELLCDAMEVRDMTAGRPSRAVEGVKPAFLGRSPHRLKDEPLERLLALEWQEQNDTDRPGRRDSLLALLLSENQNNPVEPSARDHWIAATVVQWLGSSVGRGFLTQVNRKWQEVRQRYQPRGLVED